MDSEPCRLERWVSKVLEHTMFDWKLLTPLRALPLSWPVPEMGESQESQLAQDGPSAPAKYCLPSLQPQELHQRGYMTCSKTHSESALRICDFFSSCMFPPLTKRSRFRPLVTSLWLSHVMSETMTMGPFPCPVPWSRLLPCASDRGCNPGRLRVGPTPIPAPPFPAPLIFPLKGKN